MKQLFLPSKSALFYKELIHVPIELLSEVVTLIVQENKKGREMIAII